MTRYKLDNLDGGSITLSSGHWRWYVIRLHSLPARVCEMQHLIFANESEQGDTMRVQVSCDITEVDDQMVAKYARQPDERSFRGPGGRFTIRPPEEEGFTRMWSVRPGHGHTYRTNIAIEKQLGELTSAELAAIAGARLGG